MSHILEAQEAYIEAFGSWNPDHFNDAYRGDFQYEQEINRHLLESWYECYEPIPDHIARYLDEALIVRDMRWDYVIERFQGRYYLFRNC